MPGHPVGSGPKGGDTRAAAGRAHRPRQNPNAMQGAGRANTNSRRQIRHILARARPQMTKKRGPIFLGRVGDPLPPPQTHHGRQAGLEVTPRDKAGGRPKRFYASWHGANGAAGPRQHHGGPTATLQPPLPAARKRRPRCRAGRPPEARTGPAYPSRVYHETRSVPLKGSHARRVPWGGPTAAPRRPAPPPRPAACKLCHVGRPPAARIRPVYPLASLLLEMRSPLK